MHRTSFTGQLHWSHRGASKCNQRWGICCTPSGSKQEEESTRVHMVDTPPNQNWKLTIPCVALEMLQPLGLPLQPRPFHREVLPWRNGNSFGRPPVGNALMDQRFKRTEILILNRVCSTRDWNCFPWSLLLWKCLPLSADFGPPNNCGSESLLFFLYLLSFRSFCD